MTLADVSDTEHLKFLHYFPRLGWLGGLAAEASWAAGVPCSYQRMISSFLSTRQLVSHSRLCVPFPHNSNPHVTSLSPTPMSATCLSAHECLRTRIVNGTRSVKYLIHTVTRSSPQRQFPVNSALVFASACWSWRSAFKLRVFKGERGMRSGWLWRSCGLTQQNESKHVFLLLLKQNMHAPMFIPHTRIIVAENSASARN